jgi:hypothetical protein
VLEREAANPFCAGDCGSGPCEELIELPPAEVLEELDEDEDEVDSEKVWMVEVAVACREGRVTARLSPLKAEPVVLSRSRCEALLAAAATSLSSRWLETVVAVASAVRIESLAPRPDPLSLSLSLPLSLSLIHAFSRSPEPESERLTCALLLNRWIVSS